jgi:hypothetical protein
MKRRDVRVIFEWVHIWDINHASIATCIDAALYECDIKQQKDLLKAADLGRSMMNYPYSKEYTEAISVLTILNNLRSPAIGIPITYPE